VLCVGEFSLPSATDCFTERVRACVRRSYSCSASGQPVGRCVVHAAPRRFVPDRLDDRPHRTASLDIYCRFIAGYTKRTSDSFSRSSIRLDHAAEPMLQLRLLAIRTAPGSARIVTMQLIRNFIAHGRAFYGRPYFELALNSALTLGGGICDSDVL